MLRDHVSHSYKTTGRIMVLCILTFTFLDKWEDKRTRDQMVASSPQI
jgi:hypothetical protein